MQIETSRFGRLALDDGTCDLPPDDALPAGGSLDVVEIAEDATALARVAALLDRLPDLVTAARTRMADAPDAIDFVPGWLEEEAPEVFAELFPGATDADTVPVSAVIAAFRPARLWAGLDDEEEGPTLTLDFMLSDEIDQVYGAYFSLADGRLIEAGIES